MPRSSFHRSPPIRPPGTKFLIACEGDTEEEYLKSIRESLQLSKRLIIVLNEKGNDPLSVVRTVIERRTDSQKESTWLEGDCAWAAFDGDEHRDNNPENWHQALDLARKKKVELALSNPSLELWYLLHFQDQSAYIHRDKAVAELKKHVPQYQKPHLLPLVVPDVRRTAIQRAARLDQRNREADRPFYNNPSSGMGKLIELLLKLDKPL